MYVTQAKTWYSPQAHKIWRRFSRSEDIIFSWGLNTKVGHVTLATPLLLSTGRDIPHEVDKPTHQIWNAYFHQLRKYERRCKM